MGKKKARVIYIIKRLRLKEQRTIESDWHEANRHSQQTNEGTIEIDCITVYVSQSQSLVCFLNRTKRKLHQSSG